MGRAALYNNTAADNTAIGSLALYLNTTGASNTGCGRGALQSNTTGANNTAVGYQALDTNTTGGSNTAVGYAALTACVTGQRNTAVGYQALDVCTGNDNTAIGLSAGGALTSGAENTCLGRSAGGNITSGDENICVGYGSETSSATVDGECVLGSSDIGTLRCNTQTISSLSDQRDKTEIIDLPIGLDFIHQLKPRKFKWASRDGNRKDGTYEAGFVAQELQNTESLTSVDYLHLVLAENPNRLEASYGQLVPVLVKAVQELSAKVTALQAG